MLNLFKVSIQSCLLIVLFISCETKEYDIPENPKHIINSTSELENPVSFNGLTSITNVDDYGATLNWTDSSDFRSYKIYDVTGGGMTLIASVDSPASSFNLTGLTSGTTYTYKVIGQSTDGRMAYNNSEISITTSTQPNAPSLFYRVTPLFTQSVGAENKPSFQIGGLRVGNQLKIYIDDSSCQSGQIASITVDSLSITLRSQVELAVGLHSFYVEVINPNGVSSVCTPALFPYTYQTCPLGYISVPADVDLGTTQFCVMKYEAKAWLDANYDGIVDSSLEVDSDGCYEAGCTTKNWGTSIYKPGSGAYGKPWRNIDAKTAKALCQNIGDNYDLISNIEWMAIARNIEEQAANWPSGTVGVGCLNRGNIGIDDACSYATGSIENDGGAQVTATHEILNGTTDNKIYHFSGNVFEWVDMGKATDFTLGPNLCETTWTDIETAESFCSGVLLPTEFTSDNAGNLTFTTYENVHDIASDASGNLYIATDGGLVKTSRFNERFGNYEILNGILESDIKYNIIAKNSSQGVFVAANSGLYISNDGGSSFSKKTTAHGLGSNTINDIFVDSNDYIYVATIGGLSVSLDRGSTFTNFDTVSGLVSNFALSLYVDGSAVYVGTLTGLSYGTLTVTAGVPTITFAAAAITTTNPASNSIPDNQIKSLYANGSKVYVGTNSGFSYSTDSMASFTTTTADSVEDIYLDASNNIYLSTPAGVAVSTDSGVSFSNITTYNGLDSNDVKAVYVDSSNDIFVTTDNALNISRDGGSTFNIFSNVQKILSEKSGKFYIASDSTISSSTNSYHNLTTLNGLAKNDITGGVAVDSENRIFVGTTLGLNISIDGGKTFSLMTANNSNLGSSNINDVFIDGNDDIYVATTAGLSISTDNGTTFTNYNNATNSLANDITLSVYVDGTSIYVGTVAGLSRSTDGGTTFSSKTFADGLPSNRIESIYADGATVYVGTNLGFAYSTDSMGSFTIVTGTGGLGSLYIWDIFVDTSTDYIYLATEVGMAFSKDGGVTFNNRLTTDGLASNATESVYVNGQGIVFVATESGLSISENNADTFISIDSSNGLGGKASVGLGQISGGAGGAAQRSGSYQYGNYAGIYMLNFSSYSHQAFQDGGFRCVFRPD